MRGLMILLLSILVGCHAQERLPQRILLIGNSLTYYHDMPATLEKMLMEAGHQYTVEQSTFLGYSLFFHGNFVSTERDGQTIAMPKQAGDSTATEKLLKNNFYDIVILQEGTGRIGIPKIVKQSLGTDINLLRSWTDTTKTKILLFQNFVTMNDYPKQYCKRDFSSGEKYCSAEMNNRQEEMELIRAGIKSLNYPAVPVGEMYLQVLEQHPEIELFDDETHPSVAGAYLSALTFYRYLTGNKVAFLEYDAGLEKGEVDNLKSIVDNASELKR